MAVYNDKIYLGGSSITNSQEKFAVAVLLMNGFGCFDLDGKTTISVGAGPDYGHTSAIQSDGKISNDRLYRCRF